jgi:antitoxin HicB
MIANTTSGYLVSDGQLVLHLEPAEEGGYVVTSPFNPDIITQGETLKECFEMARDAAETMREGRQKLLDAPARASGSHAT